MNMKPMTIDEFLQISCDVWATVQLAFRLRDLADGHHPICRKGNAPETWQASFVATYRGMLERETIVKRPLNRIDGWLASVVGTITDPTWHRRAMRIVARHRIVVTHVAAQMQGRPPTADKLFGDVAPEVRLGHFEKDHVYQPGDIDVHFFDVLAEVAEMEKYNQYDILTGMRRERELACGAIDASAAEPTKTANEEKGPETEPTHSPDFSSVTWGGVQYTFNASQASCFRILFDAWKSGNPVVQSMYVTNEADISNANDNVRLSDVFKQHPAWGIVIHSQRKPKGTVKLNDPEGFPGKS